MKLIIVLDEAKELGLGDVLTLRCSLAVAHVTLGLLWQAVQGLNIQCCSLRQVEQKASCGCMVEAKIFSAGKTYDRSIVNTQPEETVGKLSIFQNKCWFLCLCVHRPTWQLTLALSDNQLVSQSSYRHKRN